MTLLLVALLSYYLWSPTVYAAHYAFVKSGVTSSGVPVLEEDVYDSQFGIERISRRIVGFQVNLHMHHPTEPATSTHEAIPRQEVEVQAPMLSPNLPMTMDEINVALSATFSNLRRVVPSDNNDFVNLQILIGKLEEKIAKCGSSENEISSNDNNKAQQDVEQTEANTAEQQDQPKDLEEKSENNQQEQKITATESATATINEPENEKDAESAALPQEQIIATENVDSHQKLGKESEDNKSETNKSEEPPKPPEPVDSPKNAPDESVKQQDKIEPAQEKQNEVEELKRMVEELVGNGTETAETKEPEPPIMDKGINDADVQNSKTADAATVTEKAAAENDENIHDNAQQQPHNVGGSGTGITINGGNVDDVDVHQRKIDSDKTGHSAAITTQDEQENINVMQEIINLADIIERHDAEKRNMEEEKQKTKAGIESLQGKEGVHETSKTA